MTGGNSDETWQDMMDNEPWFLIAMINGDYEKMSIIVIVIDHLYLVITINQ